MMTVYTFHSTESASLILFLHPYHTDVTIASAHNQLKYNSLRVLEINTSHKMNKTNIIIIIKVDSFKVADFTVATVSCCRVSQNLHSSIVADTSLRHNSLITAHSGSGRIVMACCRNSYFPSTVLYIKCTKSTFDLAPHSKAQSIPRNEARYAISPRLTTFLQTYIWDKTWYRANLNLPT